MGGSECVVTAKVVQIQVAQGVAFCITRAIGAVDIALYACGAHRLRRYASSLIQCPQQALETHARQGATSTT